MEQMDHLPEEDKVLMEELKIKNYFIKSLLTSKALNHKKQKYFSNSVTVNNFDKVCNN